MPVYMIMFLHREKDEDITYHFDLTGLK